MMTSAPTIDFLVQLTSNHSGILTPLTDQAFELIHDSMIEHKAHDITDSNGYHLKLPFLESFIEWAELTATVAMYDPLHGVALLDPA